MRNSYKKIAFFIALVLIIALTTLNSYATTTAKTANNAQLLTWYVFEDIYSVPVSANCETSYTEYYERTSEPSFYYYFMDNHNVSSFIRSWPYFYDIQCEIESTINYYAAGSNTVQKTTTISTYSGSSIYPDYDVFTNKQGTSAVGVQSTSTGITGKTSTLWRVPDAYSPPTTIYWTYCSNTIY